MVNKRPSPKAKWHVSVTMRCFLSVAQMGLDWNQTLEEKNLYIQAHKLQL